MDDSNPHDDPSAPDTRAAHWAGPGDRDNVTWLQPEAPVIPSRLKRELKRDKPKERRPSRPRKSGLRPPWQRRALIAGVVLLLVGTWALWPGSRFDDAARERWTRLCTDYQTWYVPFVARLTDDDIAFVRNLGLIDVQANVGIYNYDPRFIAGIPDADYAELSAHPPRYVRSQAGIADTGASLASIDRLLHAFASWPVHRDLVTHRTTLQSHGWTRAAAYVRRVLADAPPKGQKPLTSALSTMVATRAQTAIIHDSVTALDIDLGVLDRVNDPVLQEFHRTVVSVTENQLPRNVTEDQHLANLGHALQPLRAFGDRFRETLESPGWATVDLNNFQNTGEAYALMTDPAFDSQTVFRVWLDEARGYFKMTYDWRTAWARDTRDRLAAIEAQAVTLDDAARNDTARNLRQQAARLNERVDELCAPVLTQRDSERLERLRYAIEGEITGLTSAAGQISSREAASDAVAAIIGERPLADDPYRSAVVDARWRSELRVHGDDFRRTGDGDTLRREADIARTRLAALVDPESDRSFPPVPTFGRISDPHRSPEVGALRLALIDYTRQRREDALSRLVRGRLPVDGKLWLQQRANYLNTLDEANRLSGLARDVDRMFDEARLPDDAQLQRGGRTLAQRLTEPAGKLRSDPAISVAAAPVLDRGRAVVAALRGEDTGIYAGEPLVVLAAWAGRPAIDPAASTPTGFKARLTRLNNLAEPWRVAREVRNAQQQEVWTRRIDQARRNAWTALAAAAGTPQEVFTALGLATELGIGSDTMSSAMGFNAGVVDLQRAASSTSDASPTRRDAALMENARAFTRRVARLTDNAEAGPWLARLKALTAQDLSAETQFEAAGPGRAGWTLLKLADDGSVTFGKHGQQLTFGRVRTDHGPVYVGRTELSVGAVLDLVRQGGVGPEFTALLGAAAGTDPRKGPRSWIFRADAGLTPLVVNPGPWRAGDPADPTVPGPGPSVPMNYISAETAVYVAGLAGCRLPTIEEWRDADTQWPGPGSESALNLRDTAWARVAASINARIKAGKRGLAWADSDRILTENSETTSTGRHRPFDDGSVWLRPVTDPGVSNLRGNVAELVTRQPLDPAPMLDEQGGDIQTRLKAFRSATKNAYAVIGGSALSAPAEALDEPQAYNVFTGNRGFADVGLRLAFPAPDLSPAQRVRALLNEAPLLLAARPAN